jgi:hypothetical protein
MSDIHEEPKDSEISYPDSREDQAEFQGLLDEKDDDFQEAVDAKQKGEKPDDNRPNAAMP